jgi:diadenosine tetraphosphate (Ap4A) HIT family hydrolase
MFELHQRLAADTVAVADWALCRVLLMDDATYPWLILVPRRESVVELHDLDAADRSLLVEEMARASAALKAETGADKINVAALGNVVPQLHVHVVARFTSDPAWPRPVWGAVPARPYDPVERDRMLGRLRRALG